MEQTNFTCRVDADLKQAFLRAAKANDRSASVLIRDFMRDYVQRSIQGRQETLPFDYRTHERKEATC
ncbi:CopG family ribbon-helix-helix protein [Kerstersia similis]|jgi:predicted transcriptional regulator|uniref:CopG family ribbon-helix-helix protein n=1 Tax=Kerstersia similis TaxID=206505 RepID=UPI0039EED9FD